MPTMTRLREWPSVATVFGIATLAKLLLLAPGLYHSTDFEVHRNWLAVTHSLPLKEWYWERTSEWTLDYPPLFGWFQWILSRIAAGVEPDLVKIVPYYDPSEKAVWFQRISVMVMDVFLVFGIVAWCGTAEPIRKAASVKSGNSTVLYVAAAVLFNSGLIMVDHVHFQYNGFLLGLLLLSMGLIKHNRALLGGAAFACLLMLKHLFLALAPLFFVYLLRGYCCPRKRCTNNNNHNNRSRKTESKMNTAPCLPLGRSLGLEGLSLTRLMALGSVVLAVFTFALGPLCVSDGLSVEACTRQLRQLGTRLFPFGRGLVHAYWAPNAWALYLFFDRVMLAALKFSGCLTTSDGYVGSTTGGLVRSEIMAALPSVPASVCLVLSLLACVPAFVRAWQRPTPNVFAWGVVHCSLSSFLVGFHVHEKALLIPAIVSALLAFNSRAGARMHMRLSFLAAFSASPLLPGPDLRILKVLLVIAHHSLLSSLLQHRFPKRSEAFASPSPPTTPPQMTIKTRSSTWRTGAETENDSSMPNSETPEKIGSLDSANVLVTLWDEVYLAGAGFVLVFGEVLHPWLFGAEGIWRQGMLPFLPLMAHSVYGALGVVACWVFSLSNGRYV